MVREKVSIIILNYNGYQDTIECVYGLNNIKYENLNVIIVDNSSTDGSYLILKEVFPDMKIIQTERNLGYAAGNNIGIEYAIKDGAEFICILNNDVVVTEDFLSPLIESLNSNSTPTIIGPMILENSDHQIVQSTGAFIDLVRGRVPVINYGKKRSEIGKDLIKCDYIGGACILFKSIHIDRLGYLPEAYFLFYEETEWCLRAKSKGFEIICNPNVSIKHKGSVSINRVEGLTDYLIHRNRVKFMKRNVNLIPFIFFMLYLILETTYKIVTSRTSIKTYSYYLDGLIDRTSNKYDFIYMANESDLK